MGRELVGQIDLNRIAEEGLVTGALHGLRETTAGVRQHS